MRFKVLFILALASISAAAKFPKEFNEIDAMSYASQQEALAQIETLASNESNEATLLWLDVFKAKTLYHLNKFSESQSILIRIESAFETSNDFELKEMTLRLMGQNFYRMGGFDQAMTHALKAKIIAENNGMASEQAQLINMIAAIHLRSGEFELALNNFKTALNYFEVSKAKNDVAKLKNNMAAVYIETNEFELAEEYLADALSLAIDLNRPTTTISALVNQVELYVKKGQFGQANRSFQTCLEQAANENLPSFEVWCLEAGAQMLQNQGEFTQALDVAHKAYQMAGEQQLYQSQINIGKMLVDLYLENKQFKLAVEVSSNNLTQVEAIKDEVLKLKLEEVSALNDVERTRSLLSFERAQNKLNQTNQRLTWAGIMVLIPVLLITLLLLKSKQQLVRALKAQQTETDEALVKMREAKELNEKLAKTDSLTGLYNRRQMLDVLTTASKEQCFHCHGFLLMIDVDHFKTINDRFGHSAGDKVLLQLAQMLPKLTPQQTVCARWGGEEFLVFLKNCQNTEAIAVAEKMVDAVDKEIFKSDTETVLHVTISIGVSKILKNQSINQWINQADEALYMSKKNGRNQFTYNEVG